MLASYCGICGKQFQSNETFCAGCGTPRDDTNVSNTTLVSAPNAPTVLNRTAGRMPHAAEPATITENRQLLRHPPVIPHPPGIQQSFGWRLDVPKNGVPENSLIALLDVPPPLDVQSGDIWVALVHRVSGGYEASHFTWKDNSYAVYLEKDWLALEKKGVVFTPSNASFSIGWGEHWLELAQVVRRLTGASS